MENNVYKELAETMKEFLEKAQNIEDVFHHNSSRTQELWDSSNQYAKEKAKGDFGMQLALRLAFEKGAKWADENPKSPWISVEERLPEVNQQVYAAIPNLCGTEYATLEYLGDNRWRQDTTEYTYEFSEGVTYWMPIPQLPKEIEP